MYKTLDLKIRPSSVLSIQDEYAAYCLDEAISHIISRLQKGDKINLQTEQPGARQYSRPSELYKQYE